MLESQMFLAQGLSSLSPFLSQAELRHGTDSSFHIQALCSQKFFLHINAGPHDVLKPLIQASLKWNELRDQMKVECSVKSELFRLMTRKAA